MGTVLRILLIVAFAVASAFPCCCQRESMMDALAAGAGCDCCTSDPGPSPSDPDCPECAWCGLKAVPVKSAVMWSLDAACWHPAIEAPAPIQLAESPLVRAVVRPERAAAPTLLRLRCALTV